MAVTLKTRLFFGFGSVLLMLIIVSVINLNSLAGIRQQLLNLTDEATPVVLAARPMVTTVLESSQALIAYAGTRDTETGNQARIRFENAAANAEKQYQKLLTLTANNRELNMQALASGERMQDYFGRSEQLFSLRQELSTLNEEVNSLIHDFKTTVSDLEGAIS